MFDALAPILWALLSFGLVLLTQRWIHRHLHGVALLLTSDSQWSVILYAIVLFPGVVLHELSHWLVANLLGVRTGKLSLVPYRQQDGTVRLGYVEYYKNVTVGPLRESLIGGAPLIVGTAAVLLIGFYIFGASDLALIVDMGDVDSLAVVIADIVATQDFWAWLYLLFAISNAMMPSAADRRAWPAFGIALGGLIAVLSILGFQNLMWLGLSGPIATVFGYLGMAFSMSIAVNLIFMVVLIVLEELLGRLRGMHVEYGSEQA